MSAISNLVIPSGGSASNGIKVGAYASISIQSPATLTGSITVEGSNDDGATYDPIYSDGSNLGVPASKVVPLTALPFDMVRVASAGSEAAERTFLVGGAKRNVS